MPQSLTSYLNWNKSNRRWALGRKSCPFRSCWNSDLSRLSVWLLSLCCKPLWDKRNPWWREDSSCNQGSITWQAYFTLAVPRPSTKTTFIKLLYLQRIRSRRIGDDCRRVEPKNSWSVSEEICRTIAGKKYPYVSDMQGQLLSSRPSKEDWWCSWAANRIRN